MTQRIASDPGLVQANKEGTRDFVGHAIAVLNASSHWGKGGLRLPHVLESRVALRPESLLGVVRQRCRHLGQCLSLIESPVEQHHWFDLKGQGQGQYGRHSRIRNPALDARDFTWMQLREICQLGLRQAKPLATAFDVQTEGFD